MKTEIKFCPRCGAEITTLTSGYICPKCGWGEGSSNDIIEIPFGAHDSELKGWEYTIPEGMEAKIENGKIIVREKESGDERIRKEIMDFIYWAIDRGSITNEQRERSDSWLAYLEKQKEQKSLNISAASEWLREHTNRYMNSEYNEFHKCVEYDGSIDKEKLINDFEEAMRKERKTAEWSEDSVKFEEGFKAGRESGLRDGQKYVLDNFESYGLCNPAEWSEEDDACYETIKGILEDNLTEEDKPEYVLSWFKTHYSHSRWKPSEKQMKVLDKVYHYLWADENATADMQDGLGDFIDELKSL